MSNSDKVKDNVDFLKHEVVKNDYIMLKNGKSLYNLPKHQVYGTVHNPTIDFFIQPKNSYNSNPFGSNNSNFFIDFEIPHIDYTSHEFVLRFKLENNGSAIINTFPACLCLEKISLLKNSNALGNDICPEDVFFYNLNKKNNELNNENLDLIGCYYKNFTTGESENKKWIFNKTIYANNNIDVNIELPLNLSRSNICLSMLKGEYIIRVYFKSNIVLVGSSTNLKLSNVNLALRVRELSKEAKYSLYKQPKLNHLFNRRILTKYTLPNLSSNQNYTINISGIKNVVAGALIWISGQYPSNVSFDEFISPSDKHALNYLFKYPISDVYFTDSTGRNIMNNNKIDKDYMNYVMNNHFKKLNDDFNRLCFSPNYYNEGNLFWFPFCSDGSDSFLEVYSGGYAFKDSGDYQLHFTSKSSNFSNSVEINIMWFIPTLLSLENGNLDEQLA